MQHPVGADVVGGAVVTTVVWAWAGTTTDFTIGVTQDLGSRLVETTAPAAAAPLSTFLRAERPRLSLKDFGIGAPFVSPLKTRLLASCKVNQMWQRTRELSPLPFTQFPVILRATLAAQTRKNGTKARARTGVQAGAALMRCIFATYDNYQPITV